MKMSSEIIDVEVSVVSSPETSVDRQSMHSPKPHNLSATAAASPPGKSVGSGADGDSEVGVDLKRSVAFANQIYESHQSASQNSTSVNISIHPATTHHHPLSNHHPHQNNHHHSSNSAESISNKTTTTTPEPPKKATTTGSGYTSFSISSILSRNEPKKDVIFPALPLLPLHHSPEDLHNSTMFSR